MHSSQDHRGLQGPMELDSQTLPPRRVTFLKTKTKYDTTQINSTLDLKPIKSISI
jgi:hypothetical protein